VRQMRACGFLCLSIVLAAVGCSGDAVCKGAACRGTPDGGRTSFESDVPVRPSSQPVFEVPLGAGPVRPSSGVSEKDGGDAADRLIRGADITQLQGDTLYVLSRTAGLAAIDVNDPSALKLLGRYRGPPAEPFEMYVTQGVVLVLFSNWGHYVVDDDGRHAWVSSSKLVALDATDPANIQELGSLIIAGTISDSHIVGDILYVVSQQDGKCVGCVENKRVTSIVSVRVSDPRKLTKIDELDFEDGDVRWGPRSVTLTQQRMYVAGPEETDASSPEHSTVQVIDISDAAGDLREGARVRVEGQVNSHWQMDEYQGVLRVISQPGQSRGVGPNLETVVVQTFRVSSSAELVALGRIDIQLPMARSVRAVRLDGPRGYISSAEPNPLLTLDLSDPEHPRQAGQVPLPGFSAYLEPRGERLLSVGYDYSNMNATNVVALLNVKDLAAPKLLSAVHFPGEVPSTRDGLHKAVRVLGDAGLIAVPFSRARSDASLGACQRYYPTMSAGVQLIDMEGEELEARGVAPSDDDVRRALLLHDKLLIVSDARLQLFDTVRRDQLQPLSQVVLSRSVVRALALDNGVVARFGPDSVESVSASAAEDPLERLAEVDVKALAIGDSGACAGSFEVRERFARGTQLELVYRAWDPENGGLLGLLVIDLSTPDAPTLLSNAQWPQGVEAWLPRPSSFYNGGAYGAAPAVVRTAHSISMLEYLNPSDVHGGKLQLRVFDMRDAKHVEMSVLPVADSAIDSYAGLFAVGEVVMSSHFVRSSTDAARARFFVDRFDLSDPKAPRRLDSINVPGALLSFDAASRRAITSEHVRVKVSDVAPQACFSRFAAATWERRVDNAGECVGYPQRLHLVRLDAERGVANLEDSHLLEERELVYSSSAGERMLFATLGQSFPFAGLFDVACSGRCGGKAASASSELLVLSGFDAGKLSVARSEVEDLMDITGAPRVYANGSWALLVGSFDAASVDASEPQRPAIRKRVPLAGYPLSVDTHRDAAYLALGVHGVRSIDLTR